MTRLYFFRLLGSMSVKAAHKTLVKLTPGVDFTNILCSAFMHANTKSTKIWIFDCIFPLLGSALVKALRKVLAKLTPQRERRERENNEKKSRQRLREQDMREKSRMKETENIIDINVTYINKNIIWNVNGTIFIGAVCIKRFD